MSLSKDSLTSIIKRILRRTDYHKHYFCTVISPSAGGKVDLLPEDSSIAGSGLTGIPIYNGLPGVEVSVAPGSEAILFYENGDPTKPRARLTGNSHISVSFNNGQLPFARVGDSVSVVAPTGTLTGVIIGGSPTVKG